jgi:hypothetical protein
MGVQLAAGYVGWLCGLLLAGCAGYWQLVVHVTSCWLCGLLAAARIGEQLLA